MPSSRILLLLSLSIAGAAAAAGASTPAPCVADASWLTSSTPPVEVPGGGKTLCNFQQLAWADFLALNQPLQGPGPLQYETWMTKEGLFQPSVYEANRSTPFPWGAQLPVPSECKPSAAAVNGKPVRVMRLVKKGGFADEIQQAGSNTAPLVDQSGNWVHFEQRMNKTEYDYVTGCGLYTTSCFDTLGSDTGNGTSDPTTVEFPAESIEIKTSWKVLDRGCFACHNGSYGKSSDPFPQADFSHFFAGMTIPGSGGCKPNPGVQGCPAPFSPGAARKR
jgi:hypothetical protein